MQKLGFGVLNRGRGVAAGMAGTFLLVFLAWATWPLGAADSVTVACYNVENYLRMDRYDRTVKKSLRDAPKPEEEVQAVVRIVRDIHPDVLGIIEMGSPEDFRDFQKRLSGAGLKYPHTEYVTAGDTERHVALLSRFPIVERNSQTDLSFELNGVREPFQRGILDVTLEINKDYRLRVLVTHLKSKRPVPQGEALIRRNEAILLRRHIERILEKDPETNLLLMGDLNDTKGQPPIREIAGVRGSAAYMQDILLKDAQGDRWTHHWSKEDIYSRLDYALVSKGLEPEVDYRRSRIERPDRWWIASDHRPIVVAIRPRDRKR
jgi:endonuclease/exonuclease/phosphatase family metal-dependent hydrolase